MLRADRFITAAAPSTPGIAAGPNASSASPGSIAVGIEPHPRARRVMRGQHARRQRLPAVARRHPPAAPAARGRARARSLRAAGRRGAAASAPQNSRQWWIRRRPRPAPPSTIRSIRPARSPCTCAAVVGETWPDRLADGATTGPPKARRMASADRVGGHPDRDGVEPGGGEIGDRAIRRFRAAPASADPARTPRPARWRWRIKPADSLGGGEVADMGDQRIEGGPALGLVKPGNRGRVGGVGAEAINGLGRERDQPALARQRPASATAASPAGQIRVFRSKFTGIAVLNSASCGMRNPRL